MPITREEAIKTFEEIKANAQNHLGKKYAFGCDGYYRDKIDLADAALSALRPVTREQVEKAWRGCQECKPRCGLCVHMGAWDKHGKPHICERCEDFSNFESDQRFCEVCGAPMTDEAVDIVIRRLEALHETAE